MHIAVCDDNVADRKQFERLMRRESDRRAKESGTIFSDLFGNATSLLANPMQYDGIYLDLCLTEEANVEAVVKTLIEKGVQAPIILCCSKIDYRKLQLPGDILYLDKPILVEELSKTVDHCLEAKAKAVPRIELREGKETLYVTEPDILYALQDGMMINIHLTNGRIVQVLDNAVNLFSQLENFPSFLVPTLKVLANGRYISGFKFHKIVMTDGKTFKIAKECIPYAKEVYEMYHKEK